MVGFTKLGEFREVVKDLYLFVLLPIIWDGEGEGSEDSWTSTVDLFKPGNCQGWCPFIGWGAFR